MAIVKLKAPSAWDSIPAGLADSSDVIALDRIEDNFDDGAIDPALIGTVVSGNGEVVETRGLVTHAPANADAAIWYDKNGLNRADVDSYSIAARITADSAQHRFLFLQQSAIAPIVASNVVVTTKLAIQVLKLTGADFTISYKDDVGVDFFWTGGPNWQAVFAPFGTHSEADLYEATLESDGIRWRINFRNLSDNSTVALTAWVNWADTHNDGVNPFWLGAGESMTDAYAGVGVFQYYHRLYPLGPLTAIMGEVAGDGAIIEQIPITESVETGATSRYKYNLNGAGLSAENTLAELKANLVGQAMTTLDLQWIVTSDGEAAASFDMNGGVLGGADYPIITDVRLGTVYNNGNLTGAAAIPGASDVRVAVPVDATVGDYVPAGVDVVLEDEQYGSLGTEFTGTLEPTQASYELPQEIIFEDEEIVIIEECV